MTAPPRLKLPGVPLPGPTLPRPTTSFALPPGRVATAPPEDRGTPRDQVRLLVARPGRTDHVRFADLDAFLDPGDVVVVNTSATRPAAIDGRHADGPVVVHLALDRGSGSWVVELRRNDSTAPVLDAQPGDVVALDGGGHVQLTAPAAAGPSRLRGARGVRLWEARIAVPAGDVHAHLLRHGRPISYGITDDRTGDTTAVAARIPLDRYQTVFGRHPGSAEMASAGRPFDDRLVTRLITRGVIVVPITLHAGVSSQEAGEPPLAEWAEVPRLTAEVVAAGRHRGSRVVAVGTTVTRALESAVRGEHVVEFRGWTDLVVTPERGTRVVTGLVTGWHEADASHLLLLEAVAGPDLVAQAYAEALAGSYLWHEFGDSCLLLP